MQLKQQNDPQTKTGMTEGMRDNERETVCREVDLIRKLVFRKYNLKKLCKRTLQLKQPEPPVFLVCRLVYERESLVSLWLVVMRRWWTETSGQGIADVLVG